MGSQISFSKSGTTVTVYGPAQKTDAEPIPQFVVSRAAGGQLWSYKTGATIVNAWKFTLPNLTNAMKVALQSFFDTLAEGPTNAFTYVHTDGNSYTARFLVTTLKWERLNANQWNVPIELDLNNQQVN